MSRFVLPRPFSMQKEKWCFPSSPVCNPKLSTIGRGRCDQRQNGLFGPGQGDIQEVSRFQLCKHQDPYDLQYGHSVQNVSWLWERISTVTVISLDLCSSFLCWPAEYKYSSHLRTAVVASPTAPPYQPLQLRSYKWEGVFRRLRGHGLTRPPWLYFGEARLGYKYTIYKHYLLRPWLQKQLYHSPLHLHISLMIPSFKLRFMQCVTIFVLKLHLTSIVLRLCSMIIQTSLSWNLSRIPVRGYVLFSCVAPMPPPMVTLKPCTVIRHWHKTNNDDEAKIVHESWRRRHRW